MGKHPDYFLKTHRKLKFSKDICLLLTLLLYWPPLVAQIDVSSSPKQLNQRLQQWVEGQVVFVDGTVLDTRFAYNPLLPEGMLQIEHEGTIIAGTVREVASFHYYDLRTTEQRDFVSFPLGNNQYVFLEMLHETAQYTLLGRQTVHTTIYDSYGSRSSDVRSMYLWYLFDKESEQMHLLTRKTLLELVPIERKKEVRKYWRTHRHAMSTSQLYASILEQFID